MAENDKVDVSAEKVFWLSDEYRRNGSIFSHGNAISMLRELRAQLTAAQSDLQREQEKNAQLRRAVERKNNALADAMNRESGRIQAKYYEYAIAYTTSEPAEHEGGRG